MYSFYLLALAELFVLVICTLVYTSYGDDQCFGQMIDDFTGRISDVAKLSIFSAASPYECGKLCLEQTACASFFYVNTTMLCQLHSGHLTKENVCIRLLQRVSGATYYHFCSGRNPPSVGHPAPCCVGVGFQYEATHHVCYQVKNTMATWQVHNSTCTSKGGHLFRITDKAVFDWLKTKTLDTCSDCGYQVDGTDEGHESVWTFSNGANMPYLKWLNNRPDNWGDGQNYLELITASGSDSDPTGAFNDIDSTIEKNFRVCQIDLE